MWAVLIASLGVVGTRVEQVLIPRGDNTFGGDEVAKTLALERAKFGRAETLAVLLEGPPRALRRSGPRTVRAIDRVGKVDAVSPWSRGAPPELRPRRDRVLILVQIRDANFIDAGRVVTPKVKAALEANVPAPVRFVVTGIPEIQRALTEGSLSATARAERVAIPVLLLILLLVFRGPVAAAVPLALGVSTLLTGNGVLAAIGYLVPFDITAITMLALVGLALGVDYGLLIVSRFREELETQPSGGDAAAVAIGQAGRTVVFAGAVVVVGLTLVAAVIDEVTLVAGALGGVVAATLAICMAITLLPALLTVLGRYINAWTIGGRASTPWVAPLVKGLIRRPRVAVVVALAPLVLLMIPALGLKLGPPHINELGTGDPAAKAYAELTDKVGAGWAVPFEVLVSSADGPLTSSDRLGPVARLEKRLREDPEVAAVVGPDSIYRGVRALDRAIASAGRPESRLDRLAEGLSEAAAGVERLRKSLLASANRSGSAGQSLTASAAQASRSAGALNEARASIATLASSTNQAMASANELRPSLGSAASLAASVESKARAAATSAAQVASLGRSFKRTVERNKTTLAQAANQPEEARAAVERASDALANASLATKSDANVARAIEQVATALASVKGTHPLSGEQVKTGYSGLTAAVERAQRESQVAIAGARRLASGARDLSRGLARLRDGTEEIGAGAARARAGATRLGRGLARAQAGTARLAAGVGELANGTGRLESGLGEMIAGTLTLTGKLRRGHRQSAPLYGGLKRADREVAAFERTISSVAGSHRGNVNSAKSGFERTAESGYLALAALQGTSKIQQRNADLVVNGDSGGDTARVFVIPRRDLTMPGASNHFEGRLAQGVAQLNDELDGEATATIGGRAATAIQYGRTGTRKTVPVIVLLSLVTLALTALVLRSIVLAVKAVILNLLAVGAAMGVLALVLQTESPIFGGAGFINGIGFFAAYSLIFTISMDYEVFMISRMREGYLKTGSNEAAISYGIERTARVITGAAAIMLAVFASFAIFGSGLVREIGIALSVAVAVDATLVRLILLPAAMRLLGNANWWFPRWLDRRLPHLERGGPTGG